MDAQVSESVPRMSSSDQYLSLEKQKHYSDLYITNSFYQSSRFVR
jgi:hypothetical protein